MSPTVDEHVHVRVSDSISFSGDPLDTVGCKSFPGFTGPPGESPVNSYNRPYEGLRYTESLDAALTLAGVGSIGQPISECRRILDK